ncbi:hypothetical protein PSM7751_00845 [Pseudooceanicola marinus]|uniref:Uncharacterized protein n=1 Tax=Pseudooceanicola marinus TaxID=396013 RepID=A0A1X6YL35_9RHOB|nr:hypothetical protein [Pseudooceanicola marinus]MBY5970809.1 hypothetical protein [Ferrimonas balearica]SLN24696.1 hypothetical protein PSM7751_00845 [Pseudooceanicola marinus]
MLNKLKTLPMGPVWGVVLKTVLPSVLASLGTVVAVAYSEGYSAFCGL